MAAGKDAGFTEDAFDSFFKLLETPRLNVSPFPEQAYSLLGVARARDGRGWVWLGAVQRGPNYDPVGFARRAAQAGFTVFDGTSFRQGLNDFLGRAFLRMLLIVAPFVLLAVGLSFLNLRLVVMVLAPVLLALICSLGVFGLIGRSIDIPGLMLGVVVLGMGTNFSVYLVRARQRFPDPDHPVHDSVRLAALLDGGATVLGMGTMLAAKHMAARSAGLAGLLGIGFSLGAALFLLPPVLLAWVPIGGPWTSTHADNPRRLVWSRYRFLEPRPLVSAWFALAFNARLRELLLWIEPRSTLLVLGCGYGIESAWLLACERVTHILAIEPNPARARIASTVLAERGRVIVANLSDIPLGETPLDGALLLESVARLSREELLRLLRNLRVSLNPTGRIVVFAPSERRRLLTDALSQCNLRALGPGHDGHWLVAECSESM